MAKEARKARKAKKVREEKVTARAARKKVNIRTRTRIQVRTLFVGTAVRKAIRPQSVGRIQRTNLAPVELKTKENRLVGTGRKSCIGRTTAAASSCELFRLGVE